MNRHHAYLLIVTMIFAAAGCSMRDAVKTQQSQEIQSPEVNGAPVTCGKHTLSFADAEKWDCLPSQGFLCTDPQGCPVNGNSATVGVKLDYISSIPQTNGYVLVGKPMDYGDGTWSFDDGLGWKCTLDDGCICGAAKIAKTAICYEGNYSASAALSGNCNKDNCNAFCINEKCACGDVTPLMGVYENVRCSSTPKICMRPEGCTVGDKSYAFKEIWDDYSLWKYEKCLQESGCQCGNTVCKITDDCRPEQNECISNAVEESNDDAVEESNDDAVEESNDDNHAADLPKGYRLDNGELYCEDQNGCECGSQLCPSGFVCEHDLCIDKNNGDDGSYSESFYCDDSVGCPCAPNGSDCPNGAFCNRHYGNPDYKGEKRFVCEKVNGKLKNKADLFKFLKGYGLSGSDKLENIVFEYRYLDDSHYYIDKLNGRAYKSLYVSCSNPGCDCDGTPLAKDYLCTRHTIVWDRADSDKDPWEYSGYYGVCTKHYSGNNFDDSCVIADKVFEQMCFNPKGCACGTGKIPMGDVCKDKQAHCSTTNTRRDCICGNEKLKDTNYGCYLDKFVCQADTCSCRGNDIHLGDVCEKDRVVCGVNSRTTGCICGEKALRSGYRCFRKEQRCDCHKPGVDNCLCTCGNEYLRDEDVCLDNDTPLELVLPEELSHCDKKVGSSFKNGHPLTKDLEDIIFDCTCGSGIARPGEGYECVDERETIGLGSEWMTVPAHVGWQCRRFEGCACGSETCQPGDLCEKAKDGSNICKSYLTFNGVCENHKLPPSIIADGYACYERYISSNIHGWYCNKQAGCACGDIKCEYLQSCLEPGVCSKNKLQQSEIEKLETPEIQREEQEY